MSPIGNSPQLPQAAALDDAAIKRQAQDPAKIRDAAQQFESLLLGQILRSVRESGSGWMGSSESSSNGLTEFAEQHFAAMLAQQGGLGLSDLIAQGLSKDPAAAPARKP